MVPVGGVELQWGKPFLHVFILERIFSLFAPNLPSNISKTQDLIPKINDFLAILRDAPPPPSGAPTFSKFLDPPLQFFKNLILTEKMFL